jgi:cyclopropane fatty-acyl-phospholipid synthase-like methyltransferase
MSSNSKLNRFFDSLKFDEFRTFRKEILDLKNHYLSSNHDYGNGYFYQSFEKINLSGLRKTKERVKALNLDSLLSNKFVLDVGTNTGFLIMQTNLAFKSCVAIDWDKSNINVANICKKKLQINNIDFVCDDFLKFNTDKKFDVVMSLANHTTYDGGIKNYKSYFLRLINHMNTNSILVFETHHPEIEKKEQISEIIDYLKKFFQIKFSGKYHFNNYADDNREFYIFEKIN